MKIARTVAAAALSVGLLLATGACSSGESSDPVSPAVSEDAQDGPTTDSGSTGDATTDVKSSCEEFNTIMADLRLVDPADSDGYGELADRAMAAQVSAPDETSYLFAPLYLIALDAGSGNDTSESMQILTDAVLAASGECSAQDVTLTM